MMKKPVYDEHRNALPSPENITRQVLLNGITVLSRSNFNSPTLSIKGYLQGGSLFDPEDKLGLGYLTAFGLMTGTSQRDFQSLYNQIESIGANLSFSADTLTTSFSAHCLSEDLSLMLELISDCLRSPAFPEKEFNRQKNQMLTALDIRAQDTTTMASLLFDQIVYEGHPYQHPDEGYTETVQAIQRDDLVNFYQHTSGPEKMALVIVGAVEPQHAIDAVNQTLGDWTNPQQQRPPDIPSIQPLAHSTHKSLQIPGKTQADIVMGSHAPDRHSPDYHTLRIGNNILGEFGMMGRLGQRVREEAGLAYYAYSSLSISLGPGAWEMIAGVNPGNIDETIGLITEEVRKFVTQPVSEEELADSKSNFLGRMPLLLESNSGVAVSLLNIEHFDLGLDYYLQYPKHVQAITADGILEASQKYLNPDRLAIAVAGP
jgi:zinc protease